MWTWEMFGNSDIGDIWRLDIGVLESWIMDFGYWRLDIGDLEIFGDWILEIMRNVRKFGNVEIPDPEICPKYTFSLCNLYMFQC